ncbi:MAG: alpha/beta hydrolase [Syntrophobacteraceae bacterium]
MSTTNVMIPCQDLLLEAVVAEAGMTDVAVLCHPHPLYGGDMDNNVVMALDQCLMKMRWSTVRFNFRGVGRSSGTYGEGIAEAEDLASVISYVQERGARRIHLAGYSFGAWVVLTAMKRGLRAISTILASPPLDFMDFKTLGLPGGPTLIVLGDSDSFCAVESLHSWLGQQSPAAVPPRLAILPDCDHFYWGYEDQLEQQVSAFVRDLPAEAAPERSGEPDR